MLHHKWVTGSLVPGGDYFISCQWEKPVDEMPEPQRVILLPSPSLPLKFHDEVPKTGVEEATIARLQQKKVVGSQLT